MANEIDFLPSFEELWDRAEIMQWMSAMQWPLCVIDAIMYDDDPSVDTVRRIVWQHGPIRALEILLEFLE